jgi:hypothetical protein
MNKAIIALYTVGILQILTNISFCQITDRINGRNVKESEFDSVSSLMNNAAVTETSIRATLEADPGRDDKFSDQQYNDPLDIINNTKVERDQYVASLNITEYVFGANDRKILIGFIKPSYKLGKYNRINGNFELSYSERFGIIGNSLLIGFSYKLEKRPNSHKIISFIGLSDIRFRLKFDIF